MYISVLNFLLQMTSELFILLDEKYFRIRVPKSLFDIHLKLVLLNTLKRKQLPMIAISECVYVNVKKGANDIYLIKESPCHNRIHPRLDIF